MVPMFCRPEFLRRTRCTQGMDETPDRESFVTPGRITILGARGEEYEQLLGTRTFSVRNVEAIDLLMHTGATEKCHLIDAKRLTNDEFMRLRNHLADQLSVRPQIIATAMQNLGVPI